MSSSMMQKPKFSVAIRSDAYKNLINNTLGDPERAKRFIANISSAVGSTPALQECDAGSILTSALLGESLNLAPSPQLGQFYMVPFNDKKDNVKKAQFVLGYKGYIQLAIRSGYYTKINVLEIKEGELKKFDPLNEVIECELINDPDLRDEAPTIGYYAMFEYQNGFRKALYWSKKKMLSHADKYSNAFHLHAVNDSNANKQRVSYQDFVDGKYPPGDAWKYSSFWYQDFDGMAKKTMLRQLISKWGIMSTEMQQAFTADGMEIRRGESGEFITEEVLEEQPQVLPLKPEAEGVAQPMSLADFE